MDWDDAQVMFEKEVKTIWGDWQQCQRPKKMPLCSLWKDKQGNIYRTVPVRWLGPIPTFYDNEGNGIEGLMRYPGGPRPCWGWYEPVPVTWWQEKDITILEQKPFKAIHGLWLDHNSPTVLDLREDGWYVQAPLRFSRRAYKIAAYVLSEGCLTLEQIVSLGISKEEVNQALKANIFQSLRLPKHPF